MGKIWFARHGNRLDFVQPDWFATADRRYDPPLCPDGHLQAKELGDRLALEKIDHIFVSPFLRTLQTAHYAATCLNLPLKIEAGLGEWHNPDWMTEPPKTHPPELCLQDFPLIDRQYHSQLLPEYPESFEQVKGRSVQIIRRLTHQFTGNLLIVSHKNVILFSLGELCQSEINSAVDVCALYGLEKIGDRWQWILKNDSSFLSNAGIKVANF